MKHQRMYKAVVALYLCLFSVLANGNTLRLESTKTGFFPAQVITVNVDLNEGQGDTSAWWVGLFKKGDSNLRNYLTYAYLSSAVNNQVKITLPLEAGEYELTLATDHYDQEKADARVGLRVAATDKSQISLSLDKPRVRPDSNFDAQFSSQTPLADKAWVGIFPATVKQGSTTGYKSYIYLEGSSEGEMSFTTPNKQGDYEFRLYSHERGAVLTRHAFAVSHDLESDSIKRELDESGRVSLYGIYFDTDKSNIKAESAQTLELLATLLKKSPELNIEIQGHTDNVGSADYNLTLSEQRAHSVRQYLIERNNIDQARLSAKGYGETAPKASNESVAGRAQNRRVDIVKLP